MSKFKRKIIPYKPYLKQLARNLRNNSTTSEIILWNYLKGKQMKGFDFHRQKPLDNYIVDFYCCELMLVIEIDGDSHDNINAYEKDVRRQERLESLGIKFIRFDDMDVKNEINSVLQVIEERIEKIEINHQHTPNPSTERSSHDLKV